ncbi:MAG: hypothetical protein JNJ60_00240, partial [Rhodocyclaceae bacterium]|nr:hypothetical protein [Rhodocyclaceae bacterium]
GNNGVSATGDPAMGTAQPTYTAPGGVITSIFGNDDVDTIQFGDPTGKTGGTAQNSDGYIFLGSKTRAYGSQDTSVLATDNDGEDHFLVYFLQDTATVTSPAMLSNPNDAVPGYGPDLTNLGRQNAEHTLTLDGQADTDTYEVFTLGSNGVDDRNYIINVLDTGDEHDGVDALTVYGLDSPNSGSDVNHNAYPTDDIFLLRAASFIPNETADRPGFVALLHGSLGAYQDVVQFNEESPEVERINYDTGLNGRLTVEGRGGNDAFFSDDATVITTLDGGAGDDSFQVGQIFGEKRNIPDGNLLPQDVFPELVATTRGWLSQGISAPMVVQGGSGNDTFRVYSNQ